jgi:DNA-binding GntR family transcriptional regulator
MAHQAAGQLRRGVVEGHFRPGERLLEQKMAVAFGVSQATVREALNVLEKQGFVRKLSNHGTYVTEFSPEDVVEITEIR